MTQTSLSKTGWKYHWNKPKSLQRKSKPLIDYKLRNPEATVEQVAEKFGRSAHSVYSLFYKHKHRFEQPKVIEDPFAIGHEIPQIQPPLIEEPMLTTKEIETVEVSHGQEVLRAEILRLNEEIAEMRTMSEVDSEMLAEYMAEIQQLKNDNIGYRAVISYLQGLLDGSTV